MARADYRDLRRDPTGIRHSDRGPPGRALAYYYSYYRDSLPVPAGLRSESRLGCRRSARGRRRCLWGKFGLLWSRRGSEGWDRTGRHDSDSIDSESTTVTRPGGGRPGTTPSRFTGVAAVLWCLMFFWLRPSDGHGYCAARVRPGGQGRVAVPEMFRADIVIRRN